MQVHTPGFSRKYSRVQKSIKCIQQALTEVTQACKNEYKCVRQASTEITGVKMISSFSCLLWLFSIFYNLYWNVH